MNNTNWNGSPTSLVLYGAGVTMPQTPNGSLVVGYFNQSAQNNAGRLSVTSGSQQPMILPVPALLRMFSILTNNWQGSNLNLTNLSLTPVPTIMVQAYGPGIGPTPATLSVGTPLMLSVRGAAQATTPPNWMQLSFSVNGATLETLAVVGGPLDASNNNAYVVALNSPLGDTGAGTGIPAPPGYYATRGDNSYSFQFNWGAAVVYVVNMSPSTAMPVTVTLVSL